MKAFPIAIKDVVLEDGMDLRDYFAAKAMQGFCANISRDLSANIEFFTRTAYRVADAMMEAKNDKE
jgi:type IV secretory pathway TraG/TraD family ATPase VirD4